MSLDRSDQSVDDILIVDDTLDNLRALIAVLRQEGFMVRGASSGASALRMIAADPPDLILLDIRMPEMDGYEVCRRLKADEKTAAIPVIFVSALGSVEDKIQGFAAGGVDYIPKPFQVEEVLARVKTQLTLRRRQSRLEAQNAQLQQEISERRRAEARLREANELLERRVKKRTGDLTRANVQLRAEAAERERAQAALRRSELQYRTLFETIPVGVAMVREDGRILNINSTLANMTGYTPADNQTHNSSEDFAAVQEAMRPFLNRLLKKGVIHGYETEMKVKDGRILNVRINAVTLTLENEPLLIVVVDDLTAQKQMELAQHESDEKFRAIITNTEAILFMVDSEGIFTLSEGKGLAKLDSAPGQVVGASVYKLYKDFPGITQAIQDALAGKASRDTICLSGVWLDVWYSPYRDAAGAILGAIGMAIDVTERHHAKIALQKTNRELNLLNECNQAMLHAVEETSLLQEICRIIVETGGYSLAWVGFALDNEEKEVLPVAHAGYTDDYVRSIRVSWADNEWGQGPTGRAIRTRQPAVMKNILTDPAYAPWRKVAAARGFASSIALPLCNGDTVLGALNIYAPEPDAFDVDETAQLMRLANNLTFGLLTIYSNRERQQAEASVRQLSRAVEQSPASIVITALDGRIEYVNPQFCKTTGYSAEEVIGKNPRILKSGHTSPEEYKELWDTITSGGEWRGEFHNRKKNGELYWESASISPIVDENGNITHYLAVKEDITARKQMENALQQRNKALSFINRVSHSMVSFLDIDHILGVLLEELRALWDVTAGMVWMVEAGSDDLVCAYATKPYGNNAANWRMPAGNGVLGRALTERKSVVVDDAQGDPRFSRVIQQGDYPLRAQLAVPLQSRTDVIGALQFVDTQAGRFTESDVKLAEALAATAVNAIENARLHQDLQEQFQQLKETQARLVQSEKMAAIGQLIAGIAHELNNPLASIVLYAQLMEARGVDEKLHSDLEQIVAQSRRASNVVHGLLNFVRQRPSGRAPTQINELLQSTLALLEYELRTHNVTVETDFSTTIPVTMADGHQLQQVFINLINNAFQAISNSGQGGRITIITRHSVSRIVEPDSAQSILVVIQDDGPGIPQESASRIFEPFFTTKAEGKGTGLGLAVCHNIVTDHQGSIWMESKPGGGTTFFIELPVVPPEEKADEAAEKTDVVSAEGDVAGGRILVVDDESSVLMVITRILHRNGFTAAGAKGGAAALERLQEERYDLIISDLRMPDMSGQEFYRRVIETYPEYNGRFIFTTGDAINTTLQVFLQKHNVPTLEKPFEMAALVHMVTEMLHLKKV